jgi:hypothetical protein
MKRTWILTGEAAKKAVCREVLAAPEGSAVTLGGLTRSLDQNAALWPTLTDISQQTDWHGIRLSPEEWKDLLSAGLKKTRVVPNIEGNGFVILGQSTSKMGKREFSDLLDLIHAFGNERGVAWSDRT